MQALRIHFSILLPISQKKLHDPERNVSVYERRRDQILLNGSPEQKKDARAMKDIRVGALGSGSDYTPFLQHHRNSVDGYRFRR